MKRSATRLLPAAEHRYDHGQTEAGVIRLNAEDASSLSAEGGDSFVDFLPRKSGGRRAKRIRIGGIDEASQ